MIHQEFYEREGWLFCTETVNKEDIEEAKAEHAAEGWQVTQIQPYPKLQNAYVLHFRRKIP